MHFCPGQVRPDAGLVQYQPNAVHNRAMDDIVKQALVIGYVCPRATAGWS